MRKLVSLILCVAFLCATTVCYATEYDLPNMSREELNALKNAVEKELSTNHETSSSERNTIEKVFKDAIEDTYGTDNVEWPWFDYTYVKDWDYYTILTSANITKKDGGKAKYDLVGNIYKINGDYEIVYIKVGTEVILDREQELIKDARVRKMLGFDTLTENGASETTNDTEGNASSTAAPTPAPTKKPSATAKPEVVYKNGDKGADVKAIQQRLIDLNYLSGSADGSFGKMTEDAVRRFQQDAGLPVTGIVDVATMKVLYSSDAPVAKVYRDLNYTEISRDPGKYTGRYYKFSGKVLQVIESTGWFSSETTVDLRIATKGNYDNVVYVTYVRGENESRILEDDRVTVYGVCDGLYSYTAVLGNTITLPKFSAESVTRQ